MSDICCGSGQYDALALQVNDNDLKNQDQDTKDLELEEAIANNTLDIENNEDSIISLNNEVDNLAEAVAEGGVIVNRKIGANVDVAFSVTEAKVSFPLTINETNESSVITFDANNDHVLITKGQYSITARLVLVNTALQPKSATLNLYAKDLVTLTETLIDTTGLINLTAGETVNIFPQFTYDKVSDNNILIFVREIGDVEVNLKSTSYLHISTVFTVAGSGVPTTSRNVAPFEPTLEGLVGDETTLNEVNKGYKARFDIIKNDLIEKLGNGNTQIKRNGSGILYIDSTGHVFFNSPRNIKNIADPEDAQDAVSKAFMEKVISGGAQTIIRSANDNVEVVRLISSQMYMKNGAQIKTLADPTSDQDAVTKSYVDKNISLDISSLRLRLKYNGSTMWYITNGGNLISEVQAKVRNIADPEDPQDASTKNYVDGFFGESAISSILALSAGANLGKEIYRTGRTIQVDVNFTQSAVIDDVLFNIPSGFRPAQTYSDVIRETDSTVTYLVTINTSGDVVLKETIATTNAKQLNITYLTL